MVADWPEDLTQFCTLLMTGPGLMVPVPPLTFRLVPLPVFAPPRTARSRTMRCTTRGRSATIFMKLLE